MTKVSYVVLTHKSPKQLEALARSVSPGEVYVHIDKRTPRPLADDLRGVCSSRVKLVDPLPTGWASWNIVAAALRGMEAAVADGATHVVVMSGQCLPLTTHERVSEFFERVGPVSFLRSHPVPSWIYGSQGGIDRFKGWHWAVQGRNVKVPLPNPVPPGLTLKLGLFQCVVDAASVTGLLSAANSPVLSRFFKRIWIPDEAFLHSVLATTRPSSIASENLWYMDWSNENKSHPRTLGLNAVDQLVKVAGQPSDVSGYGRAKLFARKFDIDDSGTECLERLQAELALSYV